MPTTQTAIPLDRNDPVLRRIGEALASIRFGSLEIVVHDGRVVQLEIREKLRITPQEER